MMVLPDGRSIRWPLFLALASAALILGCSEDIMGPRNPGNGITAADYRNIKVTMTGHDRVVVTHQARPDVSSAEITGVSVGVRYGASFVELQSSYSTYDGQTQLYTTPFNFSFACDSSALNFRFTVRILRGRLSSIDIDTTIHLYQYPYKSAQIVVMDSTIFPFYGIQDVAPLGNNLYALSFGSLGIAGYNMVSRQSRNLVGSPGGDHVAVYSSWLFFDTHHSVSRYELEAGVLDDRLIETSGTICGLAVEDTLLYVLISPGDIYSSTHTLKSYTFDGVQVDSIPYNGRATYYMAIYGHVLYAVDLTSVVPVMSRFDLTTRAFLSDVVQPPKYLHGIKVDGDWLYYCDDLKKFVGRMPIKDLVPVSP